jgi:CubicO group peptidase (beta-lactamase class C family)
VTTETTVIRGIVDAGFEPVRDAFAANFAEGQELGAGFAAQIDGETVIDIQAGTASRDGTREWSADTLVPVFSTTKPIAAIVVALVIDRAGDTLPLGYETPVAEVWPEFAAHGKEAYTIAEVLSHQAGLPGFVEPIDPGLWFDHDGLAAALADTKPLWPRGEGSGYHPLTWGYLAGEIVKRIDGRSLGTVLREEITHTGEAATEFWIGLPEAEHTRVAEMQRPRAVPDLGELNEATKAAFLTKWAAPDRGGAIWRSVEIPSANGIGTARAVADLYQLFANGFEWGGRPLFHAETTAPALTRSRVHGPDRVLPFTIDFASGVMRNSHGVYGPEPTAFGHSGWGGSMALGDPVRRLSCAYVMNRQDNTLQADARAVRLVEALYGCL